MFTEFATHTSPLILIAAIAVSYLLGSVPFGLVLTRMAGLGDIRTIGSGNIGATNVLRTGRKDLALLTLLLDAGKGAIAVLLVRYLIDPHYAALAGAAAFLGHCFPVFLRFKGGKGVATFFGTLFAIDLLLGFVSIFIWLIAVSLTRMSSVGGLSVAVFGPIIAYFLSQLDRPLDAPSLAGAALATTIMGVLILIRHKENIARIARGTEPKIGQKNTENTPPQESKNTDAETRED